MVKDWGSGFWFVGDRGVSWRIRDAPRGAGWNVNIMIFEGDWCFLFYVHYVINSGRAIRALVFLFLMRYIFLNVLQMIFL